MEPEGCHDATGGIVGGQVGYRWQSSAWVFGIEGQGDWADLRGSNTSVFFGPPTTNRSTIDALGLFTGQVGYAWNNVLWYVKGGAAVTNDKYEGLTVGSTVFDRTSETASGAVGPVLNLDLRRTGQLASNTITCSWAIVISASRPLPLRSALIRATTAFVRTSIWSPRASTTAGVAR
jgi:hypothetical protein